MKRMLVPARFRFTSLPKVWAAVMAVLLLTASGCRTLMLGHPARIGRSEWASLKAVYLVRDETGLHAESWRTRDRKTLKQLRAAFPQKVKWDISNNIGMNRCNRVDIGLWNGQRWVISYFRHARSMTVFDPVWVKRSFFLMNVDPEFYEALTQAIEADTGKSVDFDLDIDWNDVKTLGSHSAADFDSDWQ